MKNATHGGMNQNHYRSLTVMTVVSFLAMYVLMYAMVDRLANVIPNFNQFYMAGLMTAAMVIIELLAMSGMYQDKKRNVVLLGECHSIGRVFRDDPATNVGRGQTVLEIDDSASRQRHSHV